MVEMKPRWLRKSLTTNAMSLMAATIGTNVLGLAFWAEAAHLKAPREVGHAIATVAALTLLATLSQLNLTNVFIRLLPNAGRISRKLILRGYQAVIVLSLVFALTYVISGLGASAVPSSPVVRVSFVVALPLLAIFTLQDSVLTALRLAPWVPIENVSFAVSKLALLPLLVVLPGGDGIVASWVLPVVIAVIVVNRLLFHRVLPPLADVDGTLPGRRRLVSFVAGEYVGNICATAAAQLMPLLVVWRLGATAAAYFTLPWLVSMGITFLMWNVATSLVVEIAGARAPSDELLRRGLLLWGAIALGALVVCVIGARPLLELAGPGYAAHGAALLRLVGLSAPFGAVVALYGTLAWLDQRVWLLAGFLAISAVSVLVMTLVLLPHLGLLAVGWANLGTQAAAAIVMAPLAARRLRQGRLVEAT
jgi:O-antigen/teichoic acid export membrane protein